LNLQDDDMLISCEVHWASRFGIDETPVNVYNPLTSQSNA
jgi:hypothetical protein